MLSLKRRRREGENEQLKLTGNQSRKFSGHAGFRLLDLPSSIIIEILSRTPIKEILHCRCVCKTLLNLISHPCFVKYFISRTPFLGFLLSSKNNHYQFASVYKKLELVNTSFIPKSCFQKIIGCSNGIMCLWDYSRNKLFITNPVLREFSLLPNPYNYDELKVTFAFHFCPVTGKYKVIKIQTKMASLQSNQSENYSKTEVFILVIGSDKWRYVGDAPFPLCGNFCHVILNGHLHWIANHDSKGPIKLHSLDITKEQAHPVPAPPEVSCENWGIELGVLGESLCLFDNSRSTHLEIWFMREYGVATSWSKDYIVTTSIGVSILRPLAVQVNGMILMSHHWGEIFCYDPKERKFTEVYDFHGDIRTEAVLYTQSFLSIEHVSSGACLKVEKVKSYW